MLFTAVLGIRNVRAQELELFPKSVSVDGSRFVDDLGRTVFLNSINIANKSKKDDYIFQSGPELYTNLRKWGYNSIRLIVIWDGIEPTPGQFNEEYLRKLDQRIQWAGDNGLFVILDMHQDLFGSKFSDGAPEWATITDGQPHIKGEVWSDAYLISPAVQTAFDNFWNNKSAADGKGLQDHMAKVWAMLAKRYASNRTVIGYDLMNEPFPGSTAQEAMPRLMEAYGNWVYRKTGKQPTPAELETVWADPAKRIEVLEQMNTAEEFASVIDALEPIAETFEKTKLQPFYQKMADAIREVDSTKILFLEHCYFGNMGVKSSIERTRLSNGQPDPNVAYAPHGYDLVVDTEFSSKSSPVRLEFIFQRISEKSRQLKMPIWLGEWGAYYKDGINMTEIARHSVDLIQKYQFSNAYWSYEKGTENLDYFQNALLRPYPCYVNGQLENFSYDIENKTIEMQWIENKSSKTYTTIFTPNLANVSSQAKIQKISIDHSPAGWIIIPASRKGGKRVVKLKL